jgi:peptidoglycan/xylan/chitin deacetylase (PgdA/CDA1 family)
LEHSKFWILRLFRISDFDIRIFLSCITHHEMTMATSLPILTFHAIDDRDSDISFAPRLFQRSLAKLHEHGYRTLRLLQAVEDLRRGEPFPDRAVVMTFDDGYQSVYEEAFPVLQRYGMTATVYLTVGTKGNSEPDERLPSMEGRTMLSWGEIREMHRWGIEMGSHTLTHPNLTRWPRDRIEPEVRDSKVIIQEALGAPVSSFAYPYGFCDRHSRDCARQHYACATTGKLGFIGAGSDLYALERIDAYYLRGERLFDVMLSDLFPWYVLVRRIPREIRETALHWAP